MKQVIALMLLLVLLCGCATPSAPTIPSSDETIATQPDTKPDCDGHDSDPYVNVDKDAFYGNYTPACCYTDACYRTEHFLMSGQLEVPNAAPVVSTTQPADSSGLLIRNTDSCYLDDGNTYVVVDSQGQEVLRIYKGAAYITLEEVAAYMYAFGGSNQDLPANYTSKKVKKVGTNP